MQKIKPGKDFTRYYDESIDTEKTYRVLRLLELYNDELGLEIDIEILRSWTEEQKDMFFTSMYTILGIDI